MFQSFSRNFKGIVYVFVVVEPPWSSHGATIEQPWSNHGVAVEKPWSNHGVRSSPGEVKE